MSMPVKAVEIMHNGKKYRVTVGSLKYGQMNKILQKYLKATVEGGQLKADLDYASMEREIVIASIKEVEPAIDDIERFVDELDITEAQKLINVAIELNPLLT